MFAVAELLSWQLMMQVDAGSDVDEHRIRWPLMPSEMPVYDEKCDGELLIQSPARRQGRIWSCVAMLSYWTRDDTESSLCINFHGQLKFHRRRKSRIRGCI